MRTVNFYDAETGILLAHQYTGSQVEVNTPSGTRPVEGVTDWLSQRVDLVATAQSGAPVLVDYQPAEPAADPLRAWSWSADLKRWVSSPTETARAVEVRSLRDEKLIATDWIVTRAAERGEQVSDTWRAYRQSLRDVPLQPGFPLSIEWPQAPQ